MFCFDIIIIIIICVDILMGWVILADILLTRELQSLFKVNFNSQT